MHWILAFHLIFVVAWFAGLFYLPRLFVYHAEASDFISMERFKVMERRLFHGIMTPAGLLATALGLWLLILSGTTLISQPWMQWKLILGIGLWIYHLMCARFLWIFKHNHNTHSDRFYRIFNEIPTLFLLAMIILAIIKPGQAG